MNTQEDKMETKTENTEHKSIGAAMLAVYREIGYVQKTGNNTAQKYKYAGEADLIAALRPVLIKHGIIFYPSHIDAKIDSMVTNTQKGESFDKLTYTRHFHATYYFTFEHPASGTSIKVPAIGEGVDNGDKSSYKGATGALKYALRQSFLIETGDEPEAHEVKAEPAFKNSALRKLFFESVVATFDKAETLVALDEAVRLHKEQFAAMDNGSGHDQLAVGELRKRYSLRKGEIEQAKELERRADNGNFDGEVE